MIAALCTLVAALGAVSAASLEESANQFAYRCCCLELISSRPVSMLLLQLAMQMLLGLPMWVGVCLTLFDCLTVLMLKGEGSRGLERLFGLLILIMALGFGVILSLSRPALLPVVRGLLLPTMPSSPGEAAQLLSMLGCILMPHGLYLHSALVKSRNVARDKTDCVAAANYYFGVEAAVALTVSFL